MTNQNVKLVKSETNLPINGTLQIAILSLQNIDPGMPKRSDK